jgi:hypothetical protein
VEIAMETIGGLLTLDRRVLSHSPRGVLQPFVLHLIVRFQSQQVQQDSPACNLRLGV